MLNIDLHCHSNVSDGVLPPAEVVARAAANGVHALALTDHDDVAGLAAAQAATEGTELALIPGVEISVTWSGQTVHIVGLRIDPVHPELAAGLHNIRMGRIERAQRMGTTWRDPASSVRMKAPMTLPPTSKWSAARISPAGWWRRAMRPTCAARSGAS